MNINEKLNELYNDPTLGDGAVQRAMDNEGLTFGEAVAMFFIMKGKTPTNNHPGVFKNFVPIKD